MTEKEKRRKKKKREFQSKKRREKNTQKWGKIRKCEIKMRDENKGKKKTTQNTGAE